MAWSGLNLTVEGRKALNQAQLNNRLNFKSIVVGDGNPPSNFSTQKQLVHQLYELTELKIDITENKCVLTADFPNVDYDYYFREIGIIVTTENGDKLYVYDNCADVICAKQSFKAFCILLKITPSFSPLQIFSVC